MKWLTKSPACWRCWRRSRIPASPGTPVHAGVPARGRGGVRAGRGEELPGVGDQAADQAGSRRDRVRHPGTNCRRRVRRTLRHVHSAQHERLHRVRQLHCQGLQSQCRLPTASRVSRMTSGHRITRHDLSEGGGRITSACRRTRQRARYDRDHGRPASSSRPAMPGSTRWGNLRPPRTQRAGRGST
jgi:hypothetical protein